MCLKLGSLIFGYANLNTLSGKIMSTEKDKFAV